jgi:eukaryotic-like serine/threonine-protein kinase
VLIVREQSQRPFSSKSLDELVLGPTPYRAVELIGRGGMGEVFMVEHRFLGRRFVLKVLHQRFAAEPQYVDRMRVEAQSMARLQHPNVVEVVDFWTAPDGRPCVVMELLKGRTLARELASRGPLPVAEAVELTGQALSALGAAHRAGIVHRDVKPENLFVHEVPGHPRVLKVLDFGVARVLPGASSGAPAPLSLPTQTGAIVGSPRFMSPEAARGERVDHRADLYAVGAVLYVALAGRGPFDAGSDVPAPPSRYVEGVAPELDAIVLRAMSELPELRPQSAEELAALLRPFSRLSRPPASR